MEIIKKTSSLIVAVVRVLIQRLPYIAIATVSLAAIFAVGQYAFTKFDQSRVQAADVSNYLKYTSFTVNNFREGEDFTYTVCREFKGNYAASGERSVYLIPQGQTVQQRVFLYGKDFTGTIEGTPCKSYIVKDADYHLSVGSYQLTLSSDITVQYGIKKHTTVDSNIFTVREQAGGTVGDLQSQVNVLNNKMIQLQAELDTLESQETASGTTAKPNKAVVQSAASTSPSDVPPPQPATAVPAQDANPLYGIPLLGGILKGIGL